MTLVSEIKLSYQQDDEINKGILTVSFNEYAYVSFDIDLNDLNNVVILDYDGIQMPVCMESYYRDMAYMIMNSKMFEYFYYS